MCGYTGRWLTSLEPREWPWWRAIVKGEREARELAKLRDPRCHKSEEAPGPILGRARVALDCFR
jgi:hypothetical protein